MRPLIKIVTLITLLLTINGCGDSDKKEDTSSSNTKKVPIVKTMDESEYSNIDNTFSIEAINNKETVEEIESEVTIQHNDNFHTVVPVTPPSSKTITKSVPFPSMPTDIDLNSKYLPPELGE